MADIRRLLRSGTGGQLKGLNWKTVLTILALLTVLGTVPVLIIGIGPVAISTAVLAAGILIARKYRLL